jgi:hypothetical protein
MKTVEETRRARLQMLVDQHKGMANLCEKLGYARNETATLTRILNGNIRHERGGKPYNMGSPMAREIEATLHLECGWMDTPVALITAHSDNDLISRAVRALESMEPPTLYQAIRLLDALRQPSEPNGQGSH